ncbi:hypothetical protein [Rhodococcus sp. ARC_M6]|uniref:hypothetical protein n=1 Tax=Rhodococcus sp. ARC_M6 TaxID=2928852 RepID=UPI001FB51284|nr:hypothetical protein [Rhodococcus sp. ARC_M6]MCJ0907035.1 hypothetical protein [Rhodococcus sp. ARC_M6]
MPTDNRTIPFEDLADADLYVGAVYLGGSKGTAGDDPLAKLLPVGNQGGFRHAGSPTRGTVRLSVLYTSGAEAEWPDALDPETGVFTYFGDNRKPGRDLLKTTRGGNILLRNAFAAARADREDRLSVPPFLLFEKAGIGRAVRFLGLLVPCEPSPEAEDVLTVVRHTASGQEFENYRARFTVLDTEVVSRSWLTSVLCGADTTNIECPGAWRDWVGEETASVPGASAGALGSASTSPSTLEDDPARAAAGNGDGAGAALSDRDGSQSSPGRDPRALLLDALHHLTVHRQDGAAAFYQYVVLLWAISRPSSAARLTAFSAARQALGKLLTPFAIAASAPDPAIPWIALADSPWWQIELPDASLRQGLRPRDVVHRFGSRAGLSAEAHTLLARDENFRREAVAAIAAIGREHPALDDLLARLGLNSNGSSPGADRAAPTIDAPAGHDPAARLSAARVTVIAPEIRTIEMFERDHLGPVHAERRESALQERYLRFLEDQGHTVCRQMIVVPGESSALYTDVFDVTTGELVEVKADSGRATIRAALGQVLDYARHVPHTSKAVLVPDEPGADLVDLLLRFGVAVVWEGVSGGYRRLDPDCRRQAEHR